MTPTAISTSHWSVRTLLFWLVLACLLPGVIGAAVLFIYEYRESRAQLERDTFQTTRALVQAVDSHLLRVQAIAQSLSTADSLARRDFGTFHRRAREVVSLAGIGTNIVLRDEAGRQLLNTMVEYGEPLLTPPAPEQVRGVFATGKPTISDVFVGPLIRRPIMSVDVPVVIDGRITYALGIGILPAHFNDILKAQGLPPDWVAGVFDRNGTIIGRTHAAQKYVGQKANDNLLRKLAVSTEGTVNAVTREGTAVRSFFTRSPTTNWAVAIGIPREALQGAALRTLFLFALGVLAMFAIGLVLARFIAGRIAHSVTALTAPASALGAGAAAPVPEVHIKEAAEVASAIGRASALLRERAATLQAKEMELAEAHRLARFGTWYRDMESGVETASDSVRDIYGRDVPPFPEQRGTVLTVESWERVNAASQEAVRTGKGYDLELAVNHGSGNTIWVQSKCEAVRNSQGAVVALRGTIQDITERKRADDRLRESEERFRLLADNIPQLAWMADGTGWIYWFNQRWFEYTGMKMGEVRGLSWQTLHHPEHAARVFSTVRQCVEAGVPWEDTFPIRGANGGYRWFLARAIPERDTRGRVMRWFGTATDVTAQREIEEELWKFKVFSDRASEVHLLADADGGICYVNRLACERLGYSESELLGMTVSDIDPHYPPERYQEVFMLGKHARVPTLESEYRRKDASTFPVEISATVLELKGEWLMLAIARDITERKLAEQRVRDASLHDWLTGLPNRALIFEYGGHLLAAAQRGHGRGALLFIDLDRFKPINDTYGHETGDRVLKEVGKRLRDCTRQEDMVGRLGGDEFVVILPYLDADRRRVKAVARHIVQSISTPFRIDHLELSISPSIGISYFPEHASDVDALIHAADLAMYQAKQSGRANYQFYSADLERRTVESLAVETRLRNALSQGGLRLHYQPVVDVVSGRLIGAEALVRLEDNDGEPIGPGRFIPVAESAGLIAELGEWVAAEACRQHASWRREGLRLSIAINVSPLQFRQRSFAEKLGSIIEDTGMDPAELEIEVTESTLMESVDDAVEILNRIKSLGVKIALDDFGTGYSSLSSLSSLPLDKLKVDQSFVRRIEGDQASRAVTEAIIALGRSLRLDVVGEGIESESALRYLEAHGCTLAQGYWFSRPMPAQEFAAWSHARRGFDQVVQADGRQDRV